MVMPMPNDHVIVVSPSLRLRQLGGEGSWRARAAAAPKLAGWVLQNRTLPWSSRHGQQRAPDAVLQHRAHLRRASVDVVRPATASTAASATGTSSRPQASTRGVHAAGLVLLAGRDSPAAVGESDKASTLVPATRRES